MWAELKKYAAVLKISLKQISLKPLLTLNNTFFNLSFIQRERKTFYTKLKVFRLLSFNCTII